MTGANAILRFQKRWQQSIYVEVLLYAIGSGGCIFILTQKVGFGILGFLVTISVLIPLFKPWRVNAERTVAYIDAHVVQAGFSSGLLLVPANELSGLSKLQKHRVIAQLEPVLTKLRPPNQWNRATMVMLGLLVLGLLGNSALQSINGFTQKSDTKKNIISFVPKDSSDALQPIPELTRTSISIQYPSYTGEETQYTSVPNIKAVEGSRVNWSLEFDRSVEEVEMDLMGENIGFTKAQESYRLTKILETSGFYSFMFKDEQGNEHISDLYSLEIFKDEPPVIELKGLDNYSYFEFKDEKQIQFNASITDDFGIQDAYIIATVSKGSGESVKFREEKLSFDHTLVKGKKLNQLDKSLDLDDLKMDPGDELYFYVEAVDQKAPKANVARSETFFAVIRDTVTDVFAVEGNLGADLMPDYFRSQRQLIIDTEKLIAEQSKVTEKEFKFRSNELGFDQKQLRLKYGQFMGDETEMQAAAGQVSHEENDHDDDHDHEESEEGLLDEYTHKHDSENEHNLVDRQDHDHDHDHEDQEVANDPLHEYVHDHGDPEASTLFEKSLKAKLRSALSIMWDAELYLRLYEPEKSLPHQYRALKIIQDIKNSARIYVHRIGFDPPPIKEESRLSGDIDEIKNFDKREEFTYRPTFASTRKAIARLEELIHNKTTFDETHNISFKEAGNELARKAISEPVKYLKVLRGLRDLEKVDNRTIIKFKEVQTELLSVLPEVEKIPMKTPRFQDEIDLLFLKELSIYE